MSISIVLDNAKLVNASSKIHRQTKGDYELFAVSKAVISAALSQPSMPKLSSDFVYKTAKKWLKTFKDNNVEIKPVPLAGTDFHRSLCLALVSLDHSLENVPTFTDTFQERLEGFDEYIVRAYFKFQIRVLLKHSDANYDICRGEDGEFYE